MATAWLMIRSLPLSGDEPITPGLIGIPSNTLQTARWLCLTAGIIANVARYSGGIPLLSDRVDVVRQYARENSNIVTGFLSEGWTVGMMLTLAPILVGRRRPKLAEMAWLLVFLIGAFAGASRNTLLTAVVPGVLVALHFRGLRQTDQQRAQSQTPGRALNRYGIAAAVGVAVLALMWFQSRRILNGVGVFERTFQRQYGDQPITATLASLDLSFSGSYETLSRLLAAGIGGSDTQFTVLQGLGAVPRWLGYQPDLYETTSALSAPYYMNTATYLAAPLVDFGVTGALVASFLLGLFFGAVDRRLSGDASMAGQMIRYYVIYLAVFSVYEFVPFIQPSWIPVVVSLLIIRRASLSEHSGTAPLRKARASSLG
ncbi:O-antigen polymerase [Mycobacterium sp. WMMD1722]|uniref:O-antigen polymerase n=1 Tax=Mycobacterium sp. WMMD1722 TaxID=3404117 RepID=UPI003BF5C473